LWQTECGESKANLEESRVEDAQSILPSTDPQSILPPFLAGG
jgi:hypothetical protein